MKYAVINHCKCNEGFCDSQILLSSLPDGLPIAWRVCIFLKFCMICCILHLIQKQVSLDIMNMKRLPLFVLLILISFYSCNKDLKENTIEKWKSEIVQTEKEFAEMAGKEGIPDAFLAYAAEDVAILRNDSVLTGKEALRNFYENRNPGLGDVSLTWKPDFVAVSSSGDLGYTYGRYVYTVTDSTGNSQSREGIFHTVWKKQIDGKWRFVWD